MQLALFHFEIVTETQTLVVVEVTTDPKGSLPSFVVNLVQQGWPRKTIVGLGKVAGQESVGLHPKFSSWN